MKAEIALLLAAPLLVIAPGPLSRIAGGESASAVLSEWCAANHLPALKAVKLRARRSPPGDVLEVLRKDQGARVAFRRVRLSCGSRTLSEADNWYLPGRLTRDMNRQLDSTEAPFGRVIEPVGFTRRTISTVRDRRGRLVIRAVLVDRAGAALSYVLERYAPLPR